MIAWYTRRRCLWCSRSAIGMCWSHNIIVTRVVDKEGRVALALIAVGAMVAAMAWAGRRWL